MSKRIVLCLLLSCITFLSDHPRSDAFKDICNDAEFAAIQEVIDEYLYDMQDEIDADETDVQDWRGTKKIKKLCVACLAVTRALNTYAPVTINAPLRKSSTGLLTVNGDEVVNGNLDVNGNFLINGVAPANFSTPVSIANGGTNATSMANTDGVVYYDGTKLNTTAVGSSGQLLTSTGAGSAPAFQSFTINTDSGSVSGNNLSLNALNVTPNSGATVQFAGSGTAINLSVTDANNNIAVGISAGNSNMGTNNTIVGVGVGQNMSFNSMNNCAFGSGALSTLSGSMPGQSSINCAFGNSALSDLVSGSSNIAIGSNAGSSLTSTESDNIYIGTGLLGTAGENNTCRIGTTNLQKIFINGIFGSIVAGSQVLVSTAGQLGVATSSAQYKKNIKTIDPAIATSILGLRAVSFNYKQEELADELHYGLVAEEVQELVPNLVILDSNGNPQTVKYHELPVLLLAQIQLLTDEVKRLTQRVTELEE